jgi:CheY-like chemotaxis protein
VPKVLIIEDEAEIAGLIDRYLKRTGWTVALAKDGEDGLAQFARGDFDIVLTDGLLPRKSGFEVSVAIRAQPKGADVGLVMMSAAFKGSQARRDAEAKGVDAFFAKPFVLGDLRDKMQQLLVKYGRDRPVPAPAAPPRTGTPGARPAPLPRTGTPAARPSPLPRTGTPAARPGPAPLAPARAPTPAPAQRPAAVAIGPAGVAPPGAAAVGFGQLPRTQPGTYVLPAREDVRSPVAAARLLLACARHRLTGTVRFLAESDQLTLAFVSGVVVGASDNLREHLLGERLWKQGRLTTEQMRELNARMAERNERVAEALLALGFCQADEAFGYVEEQVSARLRRAFSWAGAAVIKESEADAQQMATASLDVVDEIVGYAVQPMQEPAAGKLIAAHAMDTLEVHPRFEDNMLPAIARMLPQAKLPALLMLKQLSRETVTVVEAATHGGAAEVYALHLLGAVRVAGDPPPDTRGVPELLRGDVAASGKLVDKAAAARVCAVLLRGRGRTFYALTDLPPASTSADLLRRIAEIEADVGREALRGKAIGPAAAAARELWQLLDEARQVFNDGDLRAAYDASLAPVPVPAPPRTQTASHEDAFLEGQQALASDRIDHALSCFARAVSGRPEDPDYLAYLGWSEILVGKRDEGFQRLALTTRVHPQAMRPVFFMGMLAARDGDLDRARALLTECRRRSPEDIELEVALNALG